MAKENWIANRPKDYDPTLARIAGNIAAGMGPSGYSKHEASNNETCREAVRMATEIVRLCREQAPLNATPANPSRCKAFICIDIGEYDRCALPVKHEGEHIFRTNQPTTEREG